MRMSRMQIVIAIESGYNWGDYYGGYTAFCIMKMYYISLNLSYARFLTFDLESPTTTPVFPSGYSPAESQNRIPIS